MSSISMTGREAAATPPAIPAWRRTFRRALAFLGRHGLLLAVVIPMLLPFYWMVATSLKTAPEVQRNPPILWPAVPQWLNYQEALTFPGFPFLLFLRNSVFYAGAVTIGSVISCAAVAYGFARLRFPGRNALFTVTLATMMIPGIITFVPTYVLFKYMGLLGTYAPLVAPAFLGSAFFIFMLRQFYMGLPWELSDAAKVDGANEFEIFWTIMLPLVRSPLMVVGVFTFLWTWNDFFGPLIYLSDSTLWPLSLGLSMFKSRYVTRWELIMAASTIATLPMVILFFMTQRYFLQGITLTGIKG
jgi:multiple sugar transport system permease protein